MYSPELVIAAEGKVGRVLGVAREPAADGSPGAVPAGAAALPPHALEALGVLCADARCAAAIGAHAERAAAALLSQPAVCADGLERAPSELAAAALVACTPAAARASARVALASALAAPEARLAAAAERMGAVQAKGLAERISPRSPIGALDEFER